jgi:hypothetical protein
VQPATTSVTQSEEKPVTSTVVSTSTAEAPAQPTLSPTEQAQQARDKIDADLERWQSKFSLAADKGVEDLEERIVEIVSALVANSANSHGKSLSTALQSVASEQISSIKQRINELAESMPEEDAPLIEESTSSLLINDIRASAISVRDRAHALREWSASFEEELVRRVTAAVNSTVDVLDSIRDLGLQEIGMRWAWNDGVTYKDWAKYHALKAQLEEWRNEIRQIGLNHNSLSDARVVANDILDSGMHHAEQAAKELVRLKDVGVWKIAAREVSDDFETRTGEPPRPLPPVEEEKIDEEASTGSEHFETVLDSEPAATSEEAPVETPNHDAPSADLNAEEYSEDDDESSMADDIVVEEEPSSKPAFGVAAANVNSPQVPILDDEDHEDTLESLTSKVVDTYAQASHAVNEAIYGASETPGVGEKAASLASDQYAHAWSAASVVLYGTPLSTGEKISSVASEKYSEAVAA